MCDPDRLDRIHPVGQVVQPVDRDNRVLRERALPAPVAQTVAPHRVPDRIADCTVADRHDVSDQVAADDERERSRRRIRPGPHERVHRVDRDRVDGHQHIGGSDLRDGQPSVVDRIGGAERLHVGRVHQVRNPGHRVCLLSADEAPAGLGLRIYPTPYVLAQAARNWDSVACPNW